MTSPDRISSPGKLLPNNLITGKQQLPCSCRRQEEGRGNSSAFQSGLRMRMIAVGKRGRSRLPPTSNVRAGPDLVLPAADRKL